MALADYIVVNPESRMERLDFNPVFARGTVEEKRLAIDVLTRAYHGIYCTSFPISTERETLDDWCERLSSTKETEIIQYFTVYGRDLHCPQSAQIGGFIVSEYYKGAALGLINYIVRDKSYDGHICARQMIDHHTGIVDAEARFNDGTPLRAMLWESNDPLKMLLNAIKRSPHFSDAEKQSYGVSICGTIQSSSDDPYDCKHIEALYQNRHGKAYWEGYDCMDPAKRIRHIERTLGARRLGISYAQAPLEEYKIRKDREKMTCSDLRLYVIDAHRYPDLGASHLLQYVDIFARSFSGAPIGDLGVDALDHMVTELEFMERESISVFFDEQSAAQKRLLGATAGTAAPACAVAELRDSF